MLGINVQELYIYGAADSPTMHVRCRGKLGEECWKQVFHHLSPGNQQCTPYHCQVCNNASHFKGKMQPHKDNGYQDESGGLKGTSVDMKVNYHIFGRDVMVVTMGDEL